MVELCYGSDGVVRAAVIRTSNGTFKTPATKLCVLPEESQPSDVERLESFKVGGDVPAKLGNNAEEDAVGPEKERRLRGRDESGRVCRKTAL